MLNLTLPQPVLFVLWRLQQEGFEAYLVGGAVRDLILGRRVNDWDFTTNATPDDLQKVFEKSFYDNQFGTVGIALTQLIEMMEKRKWMVSETIKMDGDWQEQVMDITTYRSEYGYTDRRRPDRIDWGKSLTDDLARRDFTINAMAITIKETKGMFNGLLAFVMREDELEIEADLIDPYEGLKDLAD